jgi:hypothetical protein
MTIFERHWQRRCQLGKRRGPLPSIDEADGLLDERRELASATTHSSVRTQGAFEGQFSVFEQTNRGGAMAGKFEISKDNAGKFRFHLKAANG